MATTEDAKDFEKVSVSWAINPVLDIDPDLHQSGA